MGKLRWLKKCLAVFLAFAIAAGCSGCIGPFTEKAELKKFEDKKEKSSQQEEDTIVKLEWKEALQLADTYLKNMTAEEKVGQIFMLNLEQIDNRKGSFYEFRKFNRTMQKNIEKYHIGGVILFSRNIAKRKQTINLTSKLLHADRTPLFIAVDEEGGRVARIASNPKMKTTSFPTAEEIGKTKDDEYTYKMGKTIGSEIRELGFNVNFAPVADVRTSELNEEIGDRSFGSNPDKVSEFVSAFIQGMDNAGICGTVKHFPGQGSSNGDTHQGSVDIDSSITMLRKNDFVPFQAGIAAGADFAMVSHISVSKVTESAEPASMSELIMQTILREELGFEKVIITDAFDMASITKDYTPAEAAYNAFMGGADIILMPQNFVEAYEEIFSKVADGTIGEDRLNASVLRILAVKIQRGILSEEQVLATPAPSASPTPEPTKAPKKQKKANQKKKNP